MVEFLCCGLDSKGNALISKEIQRLENENQRLKERLGREIKINRKMKSALKDISEQFDKIDFGDFEKDLICKTSRLTLKEIDNKE